MSRSGENPLIGSWMTVDQLYRSVGGCTCVLVFCPICLLPRNSRKSERAGRGELTKQMDFRSHSIGSLSKPILGICTQKNPKEAGWEAKK